LGRCLPHQLGQLGQSFGIFFISRLVQVDLASWHSSLIGQLEHLLRWQNSKFNLTKADSTVEGSSSSSPSPSLGATSLARGESWGLAFSQTPFSSLRKMFTVVGPTPLNSSSLFSRFLISFVPSVFPAPSEMV
jgi:hypothetical protein